MWLALEQLAGGFGPDGPTVTWQWLTSVAAGSLAVAHAAAGWRLSQGLGRTPLIIAAVIAIGGSAWELSLGLADIFLVVPGMLVPVAIIVLCLLPRTSQWLEGFRSRQAG